MQRDCLVYHHPQFGILYQGSFVKKKVFLSLSLVSKLTFTNKPSYSVDHKVLKGLIAKYVNFLSTINLYKNCEYNSFYISYC